MSGGRAIVGLGAGWFEREHAAYGLEFGTSPGERIGWLDEAAGIIRRLLDGERVTADAPLSVDDLRLLPDPIQRAPPDRSSAGEASRRRCGSSRGTPTCGTRSGTPETLERKIAILGDHCREVGRDIAAIELTVGANVVVRRDRATAEAVYAEQLRHNEATAETNVTQPHQRWIGTVDDIVDAHPRLYRRRGPGAHRRDARPTRPRDDPDPGTRRPAAARLSGRSTRGRLERPIGPTGGMTVGSDRHPIGLIRRDRCPAVYWQQG